MQLCAGERLDGINARWGSAAHSIEQQRFLGEMNHLDEKLISLKLKQTGANALRELEIFLFFIKTQKSESGCRQRWRRTPN